MDSLFMVIAGTKVFYYFPLSSIITYSFNEHPIARAAGFFAFSVTTKDRPDKPHVFFFRNPNDPKIAYEQLKEALEEMAYTNSSMELEINVADNKYWFDSFRKGE